ncbi:MAG: DNA helicase [Pseudomonadota bacterium]
MQLSAPIHVLKRKAKLLQRGSDIALHEALNQVAEEEGFASWSHLVSSPWQRTPSQEILARLEPGDLALIGARPGHGKTLLGLELSAKAQDIGRRGYFFSLEYLERDIAKRFDALGFDPNIINTKVLIDTSDDISADHIKGRLSGETEPALIVIDYLQLLDQKRTNPELKDQIKSLQT